MCIAIVNTLYGTLDKAMVFDTYKSSEEFENFINEYEIADNYLVLAACDDECTKHLSHKCKMFFSNMGSREIWNLGYRQAFAFIGLYNHV